MNEVTFTVSDAVIAAMSNKARRLGLSVIADGIRDGVISAPAVAAFSRLGFCSAESAAAILMAGRTADGAERFDHWRVWLAVVTYDAEPGASRH